MLDDVRKRADIENATDRFPDAELTEYINQSIARLYVMLERADYTYYRSTTTFSTVSGTATYSLQAGPAAEIWTLKSVHVYLNASGSQRIKATRFNPNEHAWLDMAGVWAPGYPVYYKFHGVQFTLSPIPNGVFTVLVEYTPAPARLSSGSETFDGVAGFEEWVILDAAIKCKQKDSLDPGLLMAEKAEVEGWILSAAERDVGDPMSIQDAQSIDLWPWRA